MAMVLWFGLPEGSVQENGLVDWMWFVLTGQAAVYAALRSGWSERSPIPR